MAKNVIDHCSCSLHAGIAVDKTGFRYALVDFCSFWNQFNPLIGCKTFRHGEVFHLKAQFLVPLEQVDSHIEVVVMQLLLGQQTDNGADTHGLCIFDPCIQMYIRDTSGR